MSLHRESTGAIVNLGQLIGRGGEGTVHAVIGAPKLVAKVYLKAPDAAKSEKLRLMVRGKSPELLGVAAWPVDLLTDERGALRGFLMSRISARQDAHRLYSPKSRRGTFPDADFRFVVRAATNLARAFAQIHVARHVIGDVNHGNALIGKDGTAVLIDCDSIQVRERTRIFTCDVGTPLFTPPELQGKAFRGLKRTEASDRFGLAVLIFHLLFQGRHPFAGMYADGEMPLERAIAESRFAYGANAASLGMSAPPGTLALKTFGRPIARLFERAFAPPGGEEERPSAIEWIEALERLEGELVPCTERARHFHPRDASCCWCAIEDLTGARLFGEGQATGEVDAVTAEELWKAIEGVPPPAELPVPIFAEQELSALAGTSTLGQGKWSKAMGGFFGKMPSILLGFILSMTILGASMGINKALFVLGVMISAAYMVSNTGDRAPPSRVRRILRIEWERAIAQWHSHSSSALFTSARAQLEQSRRSLDEIDKRQREELARIESYLEPRQRQTFLDRFEIDSAVFRVVTDSHVQTLASHGIRSASDIRRQRGKLEDLIPEGAIAELIAWTELCADTFSFDKREPTYVADVAKIEEKYRKQRHRILEVLRAGPALLAAKRDEVANARARAEDILRRKHEDLQKRRVKASE